MPVNLQFNCGAVAGRSRAFGNPWARTIPATRSIAAIKINGSERIFGKEHRRADRRLSAIKILLALFCAERPIRHLPGHLLTRRAEFHRVQLRPIAGFNRVSRVPKRFAVGKRSRIPIMSEIGHTTDGIGTIAWRNVPLFRARGYPCCQYCDRRRPVHALKPLPRCRA